MMATYEELRFDVRWPTLSGLTMRMRSSGDPRVLVLAADIECAMRVLMGADPELIDSFVASGRRDALMGFAGRVSSWWDEIGPLSRADPGAEVARRLVAGLVAEIDLARQECLRLAHPTSIAQWATAAFSEEGAARIPQRGLRLLGEARRIVSGLLAERDRRQSAIFRWARAAFSEEQATSIPQRGLRLLEEAIELFQACGGDAGSARRLVEFVFSRPPGKIGQELGGVGVTALALAAAAGLSADAEERREVDRVLSRPVEEFSRRNRAKNEAGFLLVDGGPRPLTVPVARPEEIGDPSQQAAVAPGASSASAASADIVEAGDGREWRLTTTRRELRFEDEAGCSFDVILTYDDEFGTWDAHASVAGRGTSTDIEALDRLRVATERLRAALDEVVR